MSRSATSTVSSGDVLPIATDYPAGVVLDWHEHRRAQYLYGATGTMVVETDNGTWTVPTAQGVMIPPATGHRVRMLGVSTSSLYIEPAAVPWWPTVCVVVEVSSLLRELLLVAADLPPSTTATVGRVPSRHCCCSSWQLSGRCPCT